VNDETEQGPDPNERRKHAKKLYSEREYRDRYYKILRYEPHPRQLEAHNSSAHRLMLQAGNQQGKTHCIGAQMAIDLTGAYDDFAWYKGPRALEKDILCWAASTTSVMSRDGIQTKLLGDLNRSDGLGTGLLPLDAIRGRPTMARGISNFIDTVAVSRSTGGVGTLRLKTFEQNRQAFQSEAVSRVWLDEDPGHGGADLWGECLARLTTTRGRIYFSATAAYGETPVVKYFLEQRAAGDCDIVTMGIDDALHIAKEDHARIIAQYEPWERDCRVYGAIMRGEGRVFSTPEVDIRYERNAADFPGYWPWLAAVDFTHAGGSATAHPFAYVLGAWDRSNNTIYVVRALRMRGALPVNHVAAIKEHPCWDAPICWPHDGGRRDPLGGESLAGIYRRLGLPMLHEHATFPDGGFDFEAGITEMAQRLANGTLKIAAELGDWFQEYRNFHRVDGLVKKVDDDLLSATRVLCMSIRKARELKDKRPGFSGPNTFRRPERQVARNVNFNLWTGEGDDY
jgi:phage terminase large subunit-like protein